jgi:hypothetical protein
MEDAVKALIVDITLRVMKSLRATLEQAKSASDQELHACTRLRGFSARSTSGYHCSATAFSSRGA